MLDRLKARARGLKRETYALSPVDLIPDFVPVLVTISTDNLLKTNEFRDGEGAQWPFLSDPERLVQRDLDIQEYTDPTNNPMVPHTLVLEPALKIYEIYNGYWYWGASIDR